MSFCCDILQQQQLIELIRQRDVEKALDFAQTHLVERAEDGDEVCIRYVYALYNVTTAAG